jgi:hypothetical protein
MAAQRIAQRSAFLCGALLASTLVLAADTGNRRSFVSCPIVRDTASVPCWLAEYQGETYFLTLQTDVSSPITPPWLGHRVLVEGEVSNEPRICGGVVLKPVHLSVMPALEPTCNQVLPAEEQFNLTFEPPRPPGPSKGRLAFDNANGPRTPAAPAPGGVREFVVPYDFDGMVGFNHPRYLRPVLDYALAAKARKVEIVGFRGAALLSNGQTIVEEDGIGRRRAEQVAMLLRSTELQSPDVEFTVEPTARTTSSPAASSSPCSLAIHEKAPSDPHRRQPRCGAAAPGLPGAGRRAGHRAHGPRLRRDDVRRPRQLPDLVRDGALRGRSSPADQCDPHQHRTRPAQCPGQGRVRRRRRHPAAG